ncbi:uncharacterized protein LOC134536125 isoform X2 [Bacillus rossius redtenbacheri]|uniref:uncharacterized protein LOC134536125 isoform X2 n=1 Tax=Bacillus rossius redtenbacheri TaxID=93214 RepID=UPI002FDCAEE5
MYINSNNVGNNTPKTAGEVTYVELSHARASCASPRRGSVSATPLRRQEPVVYAQIDAARRGGGGEEPSPAALPLLHPHHLAGVPLVPAPQRRESTGVVRPAGGGGVPAPRMTTTRF